MATIREILGDAYKEGMTFADIENALNGKNLADLSGGQYVSVGKYNSAIAERDDYKNKYTAKLTEAEKALQEAEEKEARYKAIERENSINRYSKKLATVKDETIRTEIATLMADGKFDEAIDKQNAYNETARATLEKEIKDELMKNNPQSNPQNNNGGAITKEQTANWGVAEWTKLYNENPDKYKELKNS
jgi:hypothetical protein